MNKTAAAGLVGLGVGATLGFIGGSRREEEKWNRKLAEEKERAEEEEKLKRAVEEAKRAKENAEAFPKSVLPDWNEKLAKLRELALCLSEVEAGRQSPNEKLVTDFENTYKGIVNGPAKLLSRQYVVCMQDAIANYHFGSDGMGEFPRHAAVNPYVEVIGVRKDWWGEKETADGISFKRSDFLYDWLCEFVSVAVKFQELSTSESWKNAGVRVFGEKSYDVFLSHRGPAEKSRMNLVRSLLEKNDIRAFLDRKDLNVADLNVVEMALAVVRCAVTLVVVEPQFYTSEWCAAEELVAVAASRRNIDSTHQFYLYLPNNMDLSDFSKLGAKMTLLSILGNNTTYMDDKNAGDGLIAVIEEMQKFVKKLRGEEANTELESQRRREGFMKEADEFKSLWNSAFEDFRKNHERLYERGVQDAMLAVARAGHPNRGIPSTYNELTEHQKLMLPANAVVYLNGLPNDSRAEHEDIYQVLDSIRRSGRNVLDLAKNRGVKPKQNDLPEHLKMLASKILNNALFDNALLTQLCTVHSVVAPLDAANWIARLARKYESSDRRSFLGVEFFQNFGQVMVVNMNASRKSVWGGDGLNVMPMLLLLRRFGYEPPVRKSIQEFLDLPASDGFTDSDRHYLHLLMNWASGNKLEIDNGKNDSGDNK